MEHRLFRETNLGKDTATVGALGYLQMLTLSHLNTRNCIAISKAGSVTKGGETLKEATVIAVPPGMGNEEFHAMITSRFTPLWQKRQVTQISNGQAHEVGSFKIRFGEVREVKAGQGAVGLVRGTLFEITADDEVKGSAELAIRQFWSELDIANAKEFMQNSGLDDGFGAQRVWLEALRIRA
ncbi:MAG: hypothetical protein MMC23_000569 [Stictis urceolatum]|nr:hypothetical protein [Stictis urceolata]